MNLIQAIHDPNLFGKWFQESGGLETWRTWLIVLKAAFGGDLDAQERATYAELTQRTTVPTNLRELWLILGRRSGKSLISALIACYLAFCVAWDAILKPGEVGTVMVLAADRKQARVIMNYVNGFIDSIPMLAAMVSKRTLEGVELSNRITIEISTVNFRTVRGYTVVAAICDELAFWRSEESANPDTEVLAALKPAMSTIQNALLICLSSPYARNGALWKAYERYFGKEDPTRLVVKAPTKAMNPTVPDDIIEEALLEDPAAAGAEWLAEFRSDIESFVSVEAITQCTIPGRLELAPVAGIQYHAFVDPAGGSGQDSMTLAVGHREGETSIVDAVREVKPPFSPEATVQEFGELLKLYRVTKVRGDRYAGEWPREQFRKHGIQYEVAAMGKSDLYRDLLPTLNSGKLELLDLPKLRTQLQKLERRTARGGKDSIDHPPGQHDDLANVVGGLVSELAKPAHRFWAFCGDTAIVDGKVINTPTPERPQPAINLYSESLERQKNSILQKLRTGL
jgi:hypothetical protein